jgi:hypothetical protein
MKAKKRRVWICSGCAARDPAEGKPVKCRVCGASFVDVHDLEDPPLSPCVRSGYCCRVRPCGLGKAEEESSACRYLEVERRVEGVPIYRCGRYEEIRAQPGWELSPAFGAGCSSTLFNEDRERVIRALKTVDA